MKSPEKLPLPSMLSAVDPAVLEAYTRRLHSGPTADYMPICWIEPMGHAWNQKVIQLLGAEFNKNVKEGRFQLMTSLPENESKDFVTIAIKHKLSRHQTILKSSM